MDQTIYKENLKESKDTEEEKYSTQSLYCLMGSQDGTIYMYDPLMVEPKRIVRYNQDDSMPFHKKKRPELIKWFEPIGIQTPSKFAVCWEDGSIYVYDKDQTSDPKEDYKESIV
jgi:hypothetical protein